MRVSDRIPEEWQSAMTEFYNELRDEAIFFETICSTRVDMGNVFADNRKDRSL